MKEKKIEYKILEGAASDVQKTLNQWKHQYMVTTLHMCQSTDSGLYVLLLREKK